MKYLFVLLLLFNIVYGQYVSQYSLFIVKFPNLVPIETNIVNGVTSVSTKDQDTYYLITYIKLTNEYTNKNDNLKILDFCAKNFYDNIKADIYNIRIYKYKKRYTKELYLIKTTNTYKHHIYYRVHIEKDYIFQIIFMDKVNNRKKYKNFYKSFKCLK